MMRFAVWVGFACMSSVAIAQSRPQPKPSASSIPTDVQVRSKTAVSDAAKRLGALSPWQKRILEEEIVPVYDLFIRTQSGSKVDVDIDAMRKQMAFYAPETLKRPDPLLVIYIRAKTGCSRCVDAMTEVKTQAQERVNRRGFVANWVTPEEIGNLAIEGSVLQERLDEIAASKSAAGSLLIEMDETTEEGAGIDRADEKKPRAQLSIRAQGSAQAPAALADLRTTGRRAISLGHTFEGEVSGLLADAFAYFGMKSLLAAPNFQDDPSEIILTVSGVQTFEQFTKLKAALMAQIPDVGSVEERRILRGQVSFAIQSRSRTARQLRSTLVSAPLDPYKLHIISVADRSIEAEIR